MEPPVVSAGKGEGQLIILQIILPHIHMVSVAGNIVHGSAGELYFFLCKFSADVSALHQFFFNLRQVSLVHGDVQSVADGFQILDIVGGLPDQFCERFECPFLLIVSGKVFL